MCILPNSSLNLSDIIHDLSFNNHIVSECHDPNSSSSNNSFTFPIQIIFNLISSNANDPQGLIRQTNKQNNMSKLIRNSRPFSYQPKA